MSTRTDVLLWAQRVVARKDAPPHLLLEVREDATPDEAQEAFHKIARAAHPDLHRHGLDATELELVTSAYAAVAGAYMQLRSTTMTTGRMRPLRPSVEPATTAAPAEPAPRPRTPSSGIAAVARTPSSGTPTVPPPSSEGLGALLSVDAAQHMSPKAITYFRKAETAIRRGDLKSAVLQIKLAITNDPASTFLRNALAEVDAELRRST